LDITNPHFFAICRNFFMVCRKCNNFRSAEPLESWSCFNWLGHLICTVRIYCWYIMLCFFCSLWSFFTIIIRSPGLDILSNSHYMGHNGCRRLPSVLNTHCTYCAERICRLGAYYCYKHRVFYNNIQYRVCKLYTWFHWS